MKKIKLTGLILLLMIHVGLICYGVPTQQSLKNKQRLLTDYTAKIQTKLADKIAMGFDIDEEKTLANLDLAFSFMEEAESYIAYEDLFEAELRLTFAERMLQKASVSLADSPVVEGRVISIDAHTLSQRALNGTIDQMVDQISSANFNTIFVEVVRGDGYTVYPSTIQEQAEILSGLDPLAQLLEQANYHDIDVFPWIKMLFAASNKTPGPILEKHPEWTALDRNGYGFEKAGLAWFSPAHPEARDFIYESLLELAQNYDFAGFQLDYVRYPVNLTEDNDFSYDMASRELFKTFYGTDPLDIPYYPYSQRAQPDYQKGDHGSLYASWLAFREELVTSLVGRVSIGLREKNPSLPISAGIITALWGGGTIQQAWFRQQNWPAWLERHYVNFLSPMIYQDDSSVVEREVNQIKDISANRALQYPSLGVYVMNSPYQLAEQIEIIRTENIAGVRIFAYPHLEGEHFDILKEGPFRERAYPPHRDLLKASILRIEALTTIRDNEKLHDLLRALNSVSQNQKSSRAAALQRILRQIDRMLADSDSRIVYELTYVKGYLEALIFHERAHRFN